MDTPLAVVRHGHVPGHLSDGFFPRVPFVRAVQDFHYVSLAVVVILYYDITITFDLEVSHMYNRRHSLVQLLWFLNRILVPVQIGVHVLTTFSPNPSPLFCHALGGTFGNWIAVVNISTVNAIVVIQTLLALRTAAIYERSLKVSLFIAVLVVGSTVSRIVVLALKPVANTVAEGFPHALVCLDVPSEQNSASFIGPVFVDATLYLMTVWRLYQQSPPNLGPRIRRTNTLLPLLYQDGAIYLFVVAAAMAMSMAGFFFIPLLGAFTESDLYIVTCSIACSRLILHLRETSRQNGYRNRDLPTSWEPSLDLGAGLTPSRVLTRSEVALGFSADPSPVISRPTEEIGKESNGMYTGRVASGVPVGLSDFSSAPPPIRSSHEGG